MNRWVVGCGALVLGATLVVEDVEARRLGGARSSGVQRNVTRSVPAQPPARQAQPAAPANQPATAAAPAAAGAAAAPSGLSRWMPMLGGLAIGGLLGSMFGGGGLAGLLLLGLAGIAVAFLLRALLRPRAEAQPAAQFAGLGNETVVAPPPSQSSGLDGSVLERRVAPLPPGVPSGFDVAGFVRAAKLNFVRLQIANDLGKLDELREFTTPQMFDVLKQDLDARSETQQQTDVVNLNADLLELTTEGDMHWASVRFSGMARETPGAAPVSFEEVWNLSKPTDGSAGWLLAGIQQMH